MKRLFLITSLALIFANVPAIASNHVIINTDSPTATFGSPWMSQNTKDVWSYAFNNITSYPQIVEINISSSGTACGVGPTPSCAGYNFTCNGTTNDFNAGSGTYCSVTIQPANSAIITIANDGKTSGAIAQGSMQFKVKIQNN